ncbi:MAG: glycoside hydrolase family 26 protein [Oscillospiraceae bacterium]|nr:glycoside hydrolase family 26 protein [Oscillospiraceae bacterium]
MIPSPQHYDLTICVCMDHANIDSENFSVTNALLLNQQKIGEFTITEPERFVRVTFPGIYLPAGQADLSIQIIDGNISLDYFEISNHTELYALSYQKQDALSNSNASPGAKQLMQFLKQNYGKNILSGQYVSNGQNPELETIYHATGKYPAIRFCDLYSENPENTIHACEDWAERGGIVGLLWNWTDPDFPLADAVPSGSIDENGTSIHYQTDAAMLTEVEITQKLQSDQISQSCAQILREIDQTAEILKPLAEQDIPVLWRPLPEAGGGWYWWGESGAEAYRWLWDVLYRRLTEYHGLHNLIWIWNGQDANYLVNPSQYDIASLDVYLNPEQEFNSRYEQFLALYHMTKGKKLLALSECSSLPDVNLMFRDHAIWSFAGLWHDDYLHEIDTEKLIAYYNSEKVITLDELKY